jgi:hypothetical protein
MIVSVERLSLLIWKGEGLHTYLVDTRVCTWLIKLRQQPNSALPAKNRLIRQSLHFASLFFYFFPSTLIPYHEQLTIYTTALNEERGGTLSFSPSWSSLPWWKGITKNMSTLAIFLGALTHFTIVDCAIIALLNITIRMPTPLCLLPRTLWRMG